MKPVGAQRMVATDDSAPVMRISVVVSTRNRSVKLRHLLDALQLQTLSGREAWELVIVDNRSTDDTANVIHSFTESSAFPIVYAFEERPGKSRALNTGIALARGAIMAFTDDDCVPAPDWLECLSREFTDDDCVCVGGRVELFDPADIPITIRVSRDPAVIDISNFPPANIPVIGCNMAIRATTLHAVGAFDVDIGPGKRVCACEDVDMLYRLVSAGHTIRYQPAVLVRHNHGRRTVRQVDRVRDDYSIGRGGFYCKWVLKRDRMVLRWAYWDMRRLAIAVCRGGIVTARVHRERAWLILMVLGAVWYLRYRTRQQEAVAP